LSLFRSTLITIALLFGIAEAVEIDFDPNRGLVEVEVIVNGRAEGTFGIDTGADRLYIDKTWAEDNDLKFKDNPPRRGVAGIHGSSDARGIDLRSLQLDDERLYNLDATVIDIGALVSSPNISHPDGLIGYDVLKRFYVTVDYPESLMELRTGEPDDVLEAMSNATPFRQLRHMIIVDVVFNDEIEVPMVLDYCASHTSISTDLAEELELSTRPGARVRAPKIAVGDDMESRNVLCVVTDFSNLKRSVRKADFEGLLGGSFLYEYKLTVDYTRKRVYLHEE